LHLRTPYRVLEADFVILGTGFGADIHSRPELSDIAGDILLWRDVYTPPPEDAEPGLGAAPYLGPGFEFLPRPGRDAPHLARLHCFNFAATLSQGKLSGDIPAISQGAERLARTIASRLFATDVEAHWQAAQDYAVPELFGDEWADAERAVAG
jgi:cation diffusion facilitator CzcD-associated flavoprotein CzcO